MTAKLKTPLESLIMTRADSKPFVWFLEQRTIPLYVYLHEYECWVTSPTGKKNLLHLYLYCVCPFSQTRSSISSYRVSCELKLCLRTRSWQSDDSHLNRNLCCFSSLNRTPRKKYMMGNHLKPEDVMFCTQFKTVDAVSKKYGASFHWQRKGTFWQTAWQDTIPLWKLSRGKSRKTRDQMRATGSNELYRTMPGHTTSQSTL